MNRFMKILIIIPVLYLIIMPVYLASSAYSKTCSRISINISDSAEYNFVTKRQLSNIVTGTRGKVLGKEIKSLPVYDIEDKINNLRELKAAEVYTTIDGVLHVFVDQRNPVMRIMPDEGGDFFLDEEGFLFRKRNLYNPRLHLVGGNINITSSMLDSVSVLDTLIKHTILKDMFRFVNYINNNSFWSAQVDQIYVDKKDEIDLIPRVGNHVIHLGTFENYEGKLKNLEAFYDKVLPEVGWNKYSKISLEFKDQIVCVKR